jgi:hypothetical protein
MVRLVREEMEKLRTGEVSVAEVQDARQRVLHSFVFGLDTRAKLFQRLMMDEYFGYPAGSIAGFQKDVAAVTAAQVLGAARARLKPEQLLAVLVGRPEDFGSPPATLTTPATSIDLTIPPARPVLAAVTPESASRGKDLLQRAQRAVGGAAKLEAIHDLVEISEFDVEPAFGGMKVEQTDRWISPGVFRQDSRFVFGLVAAFWDGKGGWLSTPKGAGPLPPAERKRLQGELFRLYFRLLLSDRMEGRTVNHVSGGAVEIFEGDHAVRLILDEKTGMPLKLQYTAEEAGGPPAAVEEIFGGFAEFSGIRDPATLTVRRNGRKFAYVRVR